MIQSPLTTTKTKIIKTTPNNNVKPSDKGKYRAISILSKTRS